MLIILVTVILMVISNWCYYPLWRWILWQWAN